MTPTRLSIEVLDADGCLYGDDYFPRQAYVCNNYADFLETYALKENLTLEEKDIVQSTIRKIIDEQHQIDRISEEQSRILMQSIEQRKCKKQVFISLEHYIDKYTAYMRILDQNLLNAIFLAANKKLIQDIFSRQNEYDELIFILGSARQTRFIDRENMFFNGTGSIFADLCFLEEYFREKLPHKKVYLNKITLPDIYMHLIQGENFEYIISGQQEKSYDNFIHDEAKLSLNYMAAHAVLKQYHQHHVHATLNFYDDKEDILRSLTKICREFPALLPDKMVFNIRRYTGDFHSIETIIGSGPIDYYFFNNIWLMARMSGHTLIDFYQGIDPANNLMTATFLERRMTQLDAIPYFTCQHYLFARREREIAELRLARVKIENRNSI